MTNQKQLTVNGFALVCLSLSFASMAWSQQNVRPVWRVSLKPYTETDVDDTAKTMRYVAAVAATKDTVVISIASYERKAGQHVAQLPTQTLLFFDASNGQFLAKKERGLCRAGCPLTATADGHFAIFQPPTLFLLSSSGEELRRVDTKIPESERRQFWNTQFTVSPSRETILIRIADSPERLWRYMVFSSATLEKKAEWQEEEAQTRMCDAISDLQMLGCWWGREPLSISIKDFGGTWRRLMVPEGEIKDSHRHWKLTPPTLMFLSDTLVLSEAQMIHGVPTMTAVREDGTVEARYVFPSLPDYNYVLPSGVPAPDGRYFTEYVFHESAFSYWWNVEMDMGGAPTEEYVFVWSTDQREPIGRIRLTERAVHTFVPGQWARIVVADRQSLSLYRLQDGT